jgi:hypothetical protein
MKLSPFRVSFDGPLDRRERWRARLLAVALAGTVLFLASGGLSMVLNASSGLLAAWTNGTSEISTTGVASPVDRVKPERAVGPALSAAAAVKAEAVIAAKPQRDLRKPETKSHVRSTRNSQSQKARQARERRPTQDDASIERQWRERAAEIGRRSPRDDLLLFR